MVTQGDNPLNSHCMRIVLRSEIEARLSNANLEMTPQRFAVLEFLVRSEGQPTLDELLQNLKRVYPRPSRNSIQRTLLKLRDAGMICEEFTNEQAVRYRSSFDQRDLLQDFTDD